jgi:hypothetical protein
MRLCETNGEDEVGWKNDYQTRPQPNATVKVALPLEFRSIEIRATCKDG